MRFNFFGATFQDLFGVSTDKPNRVLHGEVLPSNKNSHRKDYSSTPSFVPPNIQDGSLIYEYGSGAQVTTTNFEEISYAENELIERYREMSYYPECDMAIDDIVNSMVVLEKDKSIASLNLDELDISEDLKTVFREEFDVITKLLRFKQDYYQIARTYYVDGKMYHHLIIDKEHPEKGLKEIRYIDPRQIRKVKGVEKVKDPNSGADIIVGVDEFYLFNPVSILSPTAYTGIPISPDAISYTWSGYSSKTGTIALGYLYKAIRAVNMLKMTEDAMVIYRITRAPERRVFYIDVGNLPTNRAESYVKGMMNEYKNKLVYNSVTGEINDDRRYLSMQEDFWLPRREGGKGTQIETLAGGANLDQIADVDHFLKQVYKSLNIPISRLDPNNGFNLGRSTEITRDEIDFQKFINQIRNRFSSIFLNPLKVQLILKGITTESGWAEIADKISVDFNSDSYFAELKNAEILRDRIDLVSKVEPYIGRWYSQSHVRKYILRQTDEEIERIDREIEQERSSGGKVIKSGQVISGVPSNNEEDDINTEDSSEDIIHTKYILDDTTNNSINSSSDSTAKISSRRITAGVIKLIPANKDFSGEENNGTK